MREISEKLRNIIISAIPTDNLVLFYAPLYGTSPTITDRVLAANNGTFTNPKWKTLKNGLVVPNYDGVSAYIYNATANWRSTDSQGAIIVWFRTTSSASRVFFASSDTASATRYLFFGMSSGQLRVEQRNNDTLDRIRGSSACQDGKWHQGVLISDGSTYSISLDGVEETLVVAGGANTGDWFADTSARDNFTVGAWKRDTLQQYFYLGIGLVAVYSVAPSTAEILRAFNRLKGVFH